MRKRLIKLSALIAVTCGAWVGCAAKQQTLWQHGCAQPGNDASLANIGAHEIRWWCGCGKSGTNSLTLKSR